ncbi:hypothetical protein MMO38_04965 [Acinetobacter sp. NIPH 1852]|uniref:hypothetical protein n=1 Tax=Acinetobacter sp. NIPH 1852 TaxID=2923428 RepID=UPI001F4BB228|nr:hypothetical protein [Acinetobacter sp. NIPH 1852]MCH7307499.1 hypothetical protein [Acinetobacter sp. NIPH 1852]
MSEKHVIDVRQGLLQLEQQECNHNFDELNTENKVKVLQYALSESVSAYWPNLALNWIEKNPKGFTVVLKNILIKSMDKHWADQHYKIRVKRILK